MLLADVSECNVDGISSPDNIMYIPSQACAIP
jgi:hypothetical protein